MRYYGGTNEAVAKLDAMDEGQLLQVLDTLYGRANLKYGDTRDDLLREARKQVFRDYECRDLGR